MNGALGGVENALSASYYVYILVGYGCRKLIGKLDVSEEKKFRKIPKNMFPGKTFSLKLAQNFDIENPVDFPVNFHTGSLILNFLCKCGR